MDFGFLFFYFFSDCIRNRVGGVILDDYSIVIFLSATNLLTSEFCWNKYLDLAVADSRSR